PRRRARAGWSSWPRIIDQRGIDERRDRLGRRRKVGPAESLSGVRRRHGACRAGGGTDRPLLPLPRPRALPLLVGPRPPRAGPGEWVKHVASGFSRKIDFR